MSAEIIFACRCGWSGEARDAFMHRDGSSDHNPKPITIRALTGIEKEKLIEIPRTAGVMVER